MFSFFRDLLDTLINKHPQIGDLYVRADTPLVAAEAIRLMADTQHSAAEAGLLDQRVFITIKAT
jgi:hypothetical protein